MNNTSFRIVPRLRPAIVLIALTCFFMLTAIAATAQSVARATCDDKAGFSDVIAGTTFDYCVYYNESNPADYTNGTITEADAQQISDQSAAYWQRYLDLGFNDPNPADNIDITVIQGTTGGNCNGAAQIATDTWNMWSGCFNWNGMVQSTVGHEHFHRVQLAHDFDSLWFHEGTARMMEDNTFANMDNRANAMTIPFSFNSEVNDYLASTNSDVTSDPMRYESALFWKYFTEQFGSITTEPERGVDAMVALWEAAETSDDIAAVNSALSTLGAGTDFDTAFRRFTVANWTKKMSGLPDGSYNYIDEDDPNNPAVYGPIDPQQDGTGQISNGSPDTFTAQNIGRYGARYFRAVPQSAANCPVVSVSFADNATASRPGPAFYHAVTMRNTNTFGDHREAIGGDFAASFMNNNISEVVAIIGGLDDPARADVTLKCSIPKIEIVMPNDVAVANVGPFDAPGKFLAQINVTDAETDAPIAGLRSTDFSAEIGGENAIITTGSFVQDQYWLIIQAPLQGGDGTYDLEVTLSYSGGTAGDTNANSVRYDNLNTDQVLVIDRSGSMSSGNKMEAAIDAGAFYADITRDDDGLAVVPFSTNVTSPVFEMQLVDFGVRASAIGYISNLTPQNATSIGDGLEEALNQFGGSPTGNTRCSIVLLSDGMETAPKYWTDVQGDVVTKGCPVTAIAFGPEADETLMQSIATATGGANYYNDVNLSPRAVNSVSDNNLDLADIYENAQAQAKDRQRLLRQQGNAPIVGRAAEGIRHPVILDKTLQEVMLALDWYSPNRLQEGQIELWLELPDGTIVKPSDRPYDFKDYDSGHLGWHWRVEEPGLYHLIVVNFGADSEDKDGLPYQVFASARSRLTMQLLLPAVQKVHVTGEGVPIIVFLSDERPIPDADVTAIITAPDGSEQTLPLFDDGLHGDGAAADGTYGNWYDALNQAELHGHGNEDCVDKCPDPKDEGSYQVRARAVKVDEFEREVLGSFSILEDDDNNQNRIPDAFEERYGFTDDKGDLDKDQLSNGEEYRQGTDPTNSDTDGGGESDFSEVIFGRNPLDPTDDQIAAPAFFTARAGDSFFDIFYDVHPSHVGYQLMQSSSPNGPWQPVNATLDNSGTARISAENNSPVYLCLQAFGGSEQQSRILLSEVVIPRTDPILPEANMIVVGLPDPNNIVNLIFSPQEETIAFEDIQLVRFSNTPFNDEETARNATWETFDPNGMTWEIDPTLANESGYVLVYAQFMDDAGNVSEGSETAAAALSVPTAVQLRDATSLPLGMEMLLLIAAAVGLTLLPIMRRRR